MTKQINLSSLSKELQAKIKEELANPMFSQEQAINDIIDEQIEELHKLEKALEACKDYSEEDQLEALLIAATGADLISEALKEAVKH